MPHKFKITLRTPEGAIAEELESEFSDIDWDVLSRFRELSQRLALCRFAELIAMYRVFPEQSARVLFLYYMVERASAIGKLGALIDGVASKDTQQRQLRY